LFGFDRAIKDSKKLLKSYKKMNKQEIHNEVSRILLFIIPISTVKNFTNLWEVEERLKDVYHNFYKFPKDDTLLVQASNLISENGESLTAKDILLLKKKQ
jgi:hypothetical protein